MTGRTVQPRTLRAGRDPGHASRSRPRRPTGHPLPAALAATVRHKPTGARVLAARLYGAGPVTALALTCWLAGQGRLSCSRKAVRFAGLDITVYSFDSKRSPGRRSRQGPPVLRWALYQACKTHARAAAPDHADYAAVKDRRNGKRAARRDD
jgi:transposase